MIYFYCLVTSREGFKQSKYPNVFSLQLQYAQNGNLALQEIQPYLKERKREREREREREKERKRKSKTWSLHPHNSLKLN